MLLPPSGPTSTWTALGRRFSEENWLRIPWAVTRSGEPADASTATASAVPTALVQALKLCSREVRRQYLAVVFARPRPAYGTPLAQPHAVPPPRTRGHETSQPTAVFHHLEVKRRASQQAIRFGPQHGAHIRTANPQVAVLEHDAQLRNTAGGARPADLHVRDPLQAPPPPPPPPAHPPRGRAGPKNRPLCAVPLLPPPEPRRGLPVLAPPAP